ncbi:hypothetical protein B4U79_18090 [Dinothrombium tinctorium]|uniref:Uncharacterized protein n=1 Tax=Dinothrombium tinctorium TaxID=1965070 RepID=A0A3S3P1B0_9ACAR|nr:hypothetical protein B4U79_18103 [Dinothrombium tinctorium]RWS09909.1 hypothetical protein B4U79_18101 [Dinothrombium tinctorium]RWS10124.1 hypothetical protein B4U79_18090 [Dinothrombium tinctorium]
MQRMEILNFKADNLENQWISANCLQAIISLRYLTELSFKSIFIANNDFSSLLEAKGKCLKRFAFAYDSFKPDIDPHFFLQQIFKKCTNLTSLTLAFYSSSIHNVQLVNVPSLTNLKLKAKEITLDTSSERMESVETFKVYFCNSTDIEIARILSSFPSLKHLTFKGTFDRAYLTSEAVSNLKHLEKMHLIVSKDEDVANIIEMVTNAQRCIDFTIDQKLLTLSSSQFASLVEAFKRVANGRRRKEIIKLRTWARKDACISTITI